MLVSMMVTGEEASSMAKVHFGTKMGSSNMMVNGNAENLMDMEKSIISLESSNLKAPS
jgi:hypothetical protein